MTSVEPSYTDKLPVGDREPCANLPPEVSDIGHPPSEHPAPSAAEEDKKKLEDYIAGIISAISARTEQRTLNANVEYPEESFYSTLDSKLKTCTGYMKKLKNLTESQSEVLEKDFQGLNLTRYVSEATQALAEAKLKLTDVPTAVHISTLFHRRYAEFASAMMDSWKRVLPTQKGDMIANPSKIRVDLKFLPEQIAMGLLPTKQSVGILTALLQIIVENDKDDRMMLPLMNNFVKNFGFELLDIHPKKIRILANNHPLLDLPHSSLLSIETQTSLRNILSKYFDGLSKQLESENQRLRDLEKAHRRLLESRGDVPQEKLDKYEVHVAAFAKLKTSVANLAELLDRDLPQLAPKEEIEDNKTTIELLTVEFGERSGLAPVWTEEDERDFYTILPDLKATMPSMAYKDSLGDPSTTSAAQTTDEAMSVLDAVIEADVAAAAAEQGQEPSSTITTTTEATERTESPSRVKIPATKTGLTDTVVKPSKKVANTQRRPVIKNSKAKGLADLLDTLWEGDEFDNEDEPCVMVEDDQETTTSLIKQIMETFIQNLPKLTSKEAVDKMAIDFCTNLNRRYYRKRLVQALYNVPRTRADLLPLYSRLVAVLSPVMPEIGTDLCEAVRRQFRWLVRKQDPLRLESKLRSVRFIAELTKFGIFSKYETLLCLKILLNHFKHHAVEMACSLLEACGRFLYWSPDSHSRTKILLEEMLRRKVLQLFDARMDSMIENAYLSCYTPETANRRSTANRIIKVRTPMQLFIRKIFLDDLNRADASALMSLLRRLPWDDPQVFDYAVKYLSSAWKINYASIPSMANILAGIANYQDDVAVRVVDTVLDDIRAQLELNNPKFNQRRLAMVRYLGELYNYRLVDSTVIFNTLFSLVLFGWLGDTATVLDPPQHLLRLRLVCVLLSTCGEYFSHGLSRKRLDNFLVLFRRYYWLKKENTVFWNEKCPFPLIIEHLVEDTILRLRRDFDMMKSFQDADAALKKVNEKLQEKVNMDTLNAAVWAKDEESGSTDGDTSTSNSREGSNLDLTLLGGECDGGKEEERRPEPEVNPDDVDFMSAFEKLSSESYQTHSQNKVPQFKTAIPSAVKEQLQTASQTLGDGGDSMVRVGLMTKKGQKQHHIRFMDVPENTDYVSHWKVAEEHEREERKEMMRLTLDISQRQEREEYEEMVGSTGRPLPAPRQDMRAGPSKSTYSAATKPLPPKADTTRAAPGSGINYARR